MQLAPHAAALASLCNLAAAALLPPEVADGVAYAAGSVRRAPDGAVREGRLARPCVVAGVPARRRVRFHPGGALAEVELAAPHTVGGRAHPPGTTLRLDAGGGIESVRGPVDAAR